MVPRNRIPLVFQELHVDSRKVLYFELKTSIKEFIDIPNLCPIKKLSIINIVKIKPISFEALISDEFGE